MEIEKTNEQAEEFAANLVDQGDADVFRNLWARGEHTVIRGHFPDFVADETPVVVAKTKSKK